MFAAGVTVVGSSSSNEKQVKIPLPAGFSNNPVVVATAQQQANTVVGGFPDTFAVTVTGVDSSLFAVNIYRVDNIGAGGTGWGQNLQIAWIASDPVS